MPFLRLFLLLAAALSLAGCVFRTSTPQPPMYPQAQALIVDRSQLAQRVVMFQTRDTAAAVQAFFHDRLTYEGWESGIAEPDYRDYGYRFDETMYAFDVRTEAKPDGWISVRVRFTFVGPGLAFPDNYPFPPGYK